jgi:hypothetical protein
MGRAQSFGIAEEIQKDFLFSPAFWMPQPIPEGDSGPLSKMLSSAGMTGGR